MEKSLYSNLIEKSFPKLILAISEKLNDKNQPELGYMFKTLLRQEYSVDGRWASLTGQYTRVAADVVAMDSPLPLKKRDSLEKASGELPKMGLKLFLNEKQMSDIDTLLALGVAEDTIVAKIFEDTPKVISGIWERLELMFLQGLSTGVAIAGGDDPDKEGDNVGVGVRVDYNYLTANKFGVSVIWEGNTSTSKPIDDINRVIKKAQEDGNIIIGAYADQDWFDNFNASEQVRQQFAFLQGFTGTNIPLLDNTQANRVMSSKFNFTVTKVDRTIKTEKNGIQRNVTPWKKGTIVFVCDRQVGALVWTRLAEMNRPVAGVKYQTVDQYLLVSKYSKNDPIREFTSSQARVVPVIANVDRIYVQDTKTVQV